MLVGLKKHSPRLSEVSWPTDLQSQAAVAARFQAHLDALAEVAAKEAAWRMAVLEEGRLEGRVRVESVTGEKHELRAGDAFVVPAGFEGIWEVVEPCKKWYSIFESKSTP